MRCSVSQPLKSSTFYPRSVGSAAMGAATTSQHSNLCRLVELLHTLPLSADGQNFPPHVQSCCSASCASLLWSSLRSNACGLALLFGLQVLWGEVDACHGPCLNDAGGYQRVAASFSAILRQPCALRFAMGPFSRRSHKVLRIMSGAPLCLKDHCYTSAEPSIASSFRWLVPCQVHTTKEENWTGSTVNAETPQCLPALDPQQGVSFNQQPFHHGRDCKVYAPICQCREEQTWVERHQSQEVKG